MTALPIPLKVPMLPGAAVGSGSFPNKFIGLIGKAWYLSPNIYLYKSAVAIFP